MILIYEEIHLTTG